MPLPDGGGQVFVFHFPGVVHRVISGVPNQVSQRPGSRLLALGIEVRIAAQYASRNAFNPFASVILAPCFVPTPSLFAHSCSVART